MQDNWRWCEKCEGMWFNGHTTKGVCPYGGHHSSVGSGNYCLYMPPLAGSQGNWRWCHKCEGLWFNGHTTKGVCPAGGHHSSEGSGEY
jgi:hypothetical protein